MTPTIAPLEDVQDAVRAALSRGSRWVGAFVDERHGGRLLYYVLAQEHELETHAAELNGIVPSLAGETPAAAWYERELRDLHGVEFSGALDARAFYPVEPEALRRSTSPEVSVQLYGPVRSGIGESARWLIETAGEDFLSVFPTMLYKRRRVEERFAGTPLELAPFLAEHVSGATASSHAIAFASACEDALRVRIPPRAKAVRSVLLEFERIHQHLDSLAKLADDGSLSVGAAQTFGAKELVHRFLAATTGNRFARGSVAVGGTRDDILPALRREAARSLDDLERTVVSVVEALFATPSLLDRLVGTGRLSAESVRNYGGVGPVARGSGVSCDVRIAADVSGNGESIEEAGDALARASVRAAEIRHAFEIIRGELEAAEAGPHRAAAERRDGIGLARVESPQGELLYFVRIEGSVRRTAVRSASFANWPLFALSLPGTIFTDFSFIEHSFGAIQAETDR